ncbi:hypothetical protein, partial [Mesorhizobium sp. M2D.F.Ca.ET.206.01.1.1]|uniref:hypothetical protein n=1 Tax=Mesorhizobium sp. M2D.F.Ca.ET.206.01.1.1 TaxID=2563939 RepID=UPI001AEE3563
MPVAILEASGRIDQFLASTMGAFAMDVFCRTPISLQEIPVSEPRAPDGAAFPYRAARLSRRSRPVFSWTPGRNRFRLQAQKRLSFWRKHNQLVSFPCISSWWRPNDFDP